MPYGIVGWIFYFIEHYFYRINLWLRSINCYHLFSIRPTKCSPLLLRWTMLEFLQCVLLPNSFKPLMVLTCELCSLFRMVFFFHCCMRAHWSDVFEPILCRNRVLFNFKLCTNECIYVYVRSILLYIRVYAMHAFKLRGRIMRCKVFRFQYKKD